MHTLFRLLRMICAASLQLIVSVVGTSAFPQWRAVTGEDENYVDAIPL
jgi:hypothetical protein